MNKYIKIIIILLIALIFMSVTLSKFYSDALFTILKKSTDFTILNYENLNGNISVDLVVQDDPGWLREDFIKLEAKILLQEYKLFPRKDANEFKGIKSDFLPNRNQLEKLQESKHLNKRHKNMIGKRWILTKCKIM